jgi:PST family polysaccharide transporter
MSATVALNALMLVPDAILQRQFSFVRRLFVAPSAALTFGLVAGIACALGLGVWGLVVGRYASIVVELIVLWALVDWRPRRSLMSIAMWRSLARYGRHIFAAAFLGQSRESIFTALLGRFVSIEAVGQYRYATTITQLPRMAWVTGSSYVLFPAFARIAHDTERFTSAFLRTVRWMGIVTFPACAILLPLGPALVVCVLGERWREAGYAVMALVGAPIAGGLASVVSEGVKSVGQPSILSRTALVGTILTIAFMLAFLPLGVVGVAGGVSISTLVTTAYIVKLALPAIGVSWSAVLGKLWTSFVATAVMVAVLFPLEWLVVHSDTRTIAVGIALLLAESLLGFAVFLAALRVLDPAAVASIGQGLRALRGRLWKRAPAHGPATG